MLIIFGRDVHYLFRLKASNDVGATTPMTHTESALKRCNFSYTTYKLEGFQSIDDPAFSPT